MSFRQVERIVITNVSCNHVEHQGRPIDTMCLNTQCQEVSSLCSRCLLKGHSQCRDKVCELELIPGKLINLRQLQLDVVVLQENVNQQFKELISQIEQILSPLSKYQESPNLTNLNQIGSLLRQDPRTRIIQSINETKTQIKGLLENEKVNEQIEIHLVPQQSKQVSKAEYLEELKQSAKEWQEKGRILQWQGKFKESIDYYDKAIELDPKHIDSWYRKGLALFWQRKYKEAIQCCEDALKYLPNNSKIQNLLSDSKNCLQESQNNK